MSSRELSGIVAQAERLTIAALLAMPNAFAGGGYLAADDFADETMREIYTAIAACVHDAEDPDPFAVAARLANAGQLERCGGIRGLCELAEVGTGRSVEQVAWRVSAGSQMRQVAASLERAQQMLEAAQLEDAPRLRDRLAEVFAGQGGAQFGDRVTTLAEAQKRVVDVMRRRREAPDEPLGVPVGLEAVDRRWVALEPSQLVVIGARPAMGKTAFAVNLAMNAARTGPGFVVYFSAEVASTKLALRTLAIDSGVGGRVIRTGRASDSEVGEVVAGLHRMKPWSERMLLDDTPAQTPTTVRRRLRKVARHGPIRLVIVDHMQLMRPSERRGTEEAAQADVVDGLLFAAKEFEVPTVALSQLNRQLESRPDKRPKMSDLRGSGAIEQDADIIAFLYRDEVYDERTEHKGIAEIISAKVREDAPGTDLVRFDPATQRFSDVLVPRENTGASTHASRSHEPPERAPGWDDPSARGWHG